MKLEMTMLNRLYSAQMKTFRVTGGKSKEALNAAQEAFPDRSSIDCRARGSKDSFLEKYCDQP